MSDKYNQIKQTWKIKSILNEAANDWKQLYGCYPTVKEFINLINEHSSVLPNTSNILVEDRLITSNDITWLSETIINEQAVGEEYFTNAKPQDIENLIKSAPGMETKIRERYARAQAAKIDNTNAAAGKRTNAERTAAESASGPTKPNTAQAAAAAAAKAEKTAKDRSAQEAEKAAEAKGRKDQVGAPPSAAAPAQERVRVTPEEAAKATATDWRTRSSDPAERIRQKEASDAERARARRAARPASSSPPPTEVKPSWGERLTTGGLDAADKFGKTVLTGVEKVGTGALETGKFAARLPGGLIGAIPMVAGAYGGDYVGREIGGGDVGALAGEVVGSWAANNAAYGGAEWAGKKISNAASKIIPQGVQNTGKTVAKKWSDFRDKVPLSDLLRVPPKDGPGLLQRNQLTLGGAGGMAAAGLASNWADEEGKKLFPAYKAWGEANPGKKFATKLAVDLPLMTAGAHLGNKASAMVAGAAAANWADRKAQEYFPGYKAWGEANPKTKIATTLPMMATGAYLGNKALNAAAPTVAKATTKLAAAAPKTANILGKVGKFAPWLGLAAAGYGVLGGVNRAMGDDLVGGGLEVASNIAAPIPVVGIPASLAIDAVGAYRDMSPEDREKLHQTAKDTVNIPKQVKNVAQGIVPSGLSVPPESEDEKQIRRMLDSDNEQENPKRKLQPVNEQFEMSPSSVKLISKEILDVLAKKLDTTIAREVPGVLEKEAVRVPFEIPSYTNHPITVANSNRSSTLRPNPISYDPIDAITLPTAASPTITTTNTSTGTGIQTSTTTFPIPKMAAPSLPATKAVPTLPVTKKADTSILPAVETKTDTSAATKTKTKAKTSTLTDVKTTTDPAIKTEVDTQIDTPFPVRSVIGTPDVIEDDDNTQNNFTRFASTLSDPSLPDFDAETERLHARKGTYLPQWNQGTQRYNNTAQTIQINEKNEKNVKPIKRESHVSEDPGVEDAAPRLHGTELSARKGVSMPYWDQGTQSYRSIAQTVGLQESRSGTLNTKSALQARAKKQRYKVTVMENGKKLEVFATSIRGIRRVVYGKKNFRVHDGKGADITNYFKRLMSSNKSA